MPALLSILKPHVKDLGSFTVRRLLPAAAQRMIGPFIFWDHMGPAAFKPGDGINVRPHPHIGLATVTYLFEGAMLHRDSLGTVQVVLPGDVNWMVAGNGMVHSERSRPEDLITGYRVHGIQSWVALPQAHEQGAPSFSHHLKASLPMIRPPGTELRLIAGTAFGERSPVPVYSDTLYLAAKLSANATFELPPEHEDRAVYVVEGDVMVAGVMIAPAQMAVLTPGETVSIHAATDARLMILGGAQMDGKRNFVASRRELIDNARMRWREQRFAPVPGETEFIPLPD